MIECAAISAAIRTIYAVRSRRPSVLQGIIIRHMNDLSKDAVNWLAVGDDGEGQRVDNYLVKILKGVPKSHIYRILRSGEVRVNRRKVGPDARLALRRPASDPADPGVGARGEPGAGGGRSRRASPDPLRRRGADRVEQARRSRGSRGKRHLVRRDRAAAPGAPGRRLSGARPPARPRHVRRAHRRQKARAR